MQFSIVDVFAEARYEGNQLAVVEDAADLAPAQMQRIAREMNFSETTFVTARDGTGASVRIFTPGEELPFAGHPTLGTAWVLTGGRGGIVLRLGAGDVPVRFDGGLGWLTPPPAQPGDALPPAQAAALIGLEEQALEPSLEPQIIECGPVFPIVAVRSLAALRRVRVDHEAQQRLGVPGFPFVFCAGGYSADADYAARMIFFDGMALREDPATGSANAALAHYLRARGVAGHRIVEQGFEIGRPSRLHLEIGAENAIGGRVQAVARGELL